MADTDQERADLNALIRAAHETIQDLRAAEKRLDEQVAEANEVVNLLEKTVKAMENSIHTMVETEVRELIEKNTLDNLEAYDQSWKDQIKNAERAIFARFDTLFAEMVGNPLTKGFPTIAEEVTRRKV